MVLLAHLELQDKVALLDFRAHQVLEEILVSVEIQEYKGLKVLLDLKVLPDKEAIQELLGLLVPQVELET